MTSTELYGLVLAVGVFAVAVALAGWHWVELRKPAPIGSEADALHFARQNARRCAVAGIKMVLVPLLFVGSRTGHRLNGRPNAVFIAVWLVVFTLVTALLILAGIDWLATRQFARRTRSAIVREGMELLGEEMKARARQASKKREDGDGSMVN